MKRNVSLSLVSLVAIVVAIAPQSAPADMYTVEFSEVILPSLTPLDGTTYFDPYGISFSDTTYYAIDTRFPPAGVDDYGITTTNGPDNYMTVNFAIDALSVTFDWVTITGNSIYATAYDSGNTALDSWSMTGLTGTTYGVHTFSGVGPIHHVSWHDGTGYIGVGRLNWTTIPAPDAAFLGMIGITIIGSIIRRLR
jgi:hypothetical protein